MSLSDLGFEEALRGRRVLVTGHTGFCGGWLSLWLENLGCHLVGIALQADQKPSLFEVAEIDSVIDSRIADIRDQDAVATIMTEVRPDLVLHLAAQPLVRRSYREPVATLDTNIMGTAHVLEACRSARVRTAVCVTTDKVYRNLNLGKAFKETDELGAHDPYSASKAAAEFVVACYQQSYGKELSIAAARGGNVIGGGDWSEDRLIPDAVRAVVANQPIILRNPSATRPWQHVLALCHGYLKLASALLTGTEFVAPAFNFGPVGGTELPVKEVLRIFLDNWRPTEVKIEPANLYEAGLLGVDSTRAREDLGWHPAWETEQAIAKTADWYRAFYDDHQPAQLICRGQIDEYRSAIEAI